VIWPFLFQLVSGDFVLPYAWMEHCALTPTAQCAVSNVTLADVARVHKVINEGIAPAKEADERWTVFPASRRGDCDDYAVTKRAALLALGVKPEAMALELGDGFRDGEWRRHLVLNVTVAGRTWVLDNLEKDALYAPDKRPYPWRTAATQSGAGIVWTPPQ
jgi:predicted transglutaminase-like cysteine proteinase